MNNKINEIRTVELFAGVGGFRVGLERSSDLFKTIWANQWEPGASRQHAYDCYVSHFGKSDNYINEDIATVVDAVPEHDLLVGGFPCQDYSVAQTNAKGIEGKKGVLWWSIRDIIIKRHPKFILLENVDRLIKSPTKQRGRDFGIILRSLFDEGYYVEWRVINAADYGYGQKRRRTFIFACRSDIMKSKFNTPAETLLKTGFFATTFPIAGVNMLKPQTDIDITPKKFRTLVDISDCFAAPFFNSGVMVDGKITSIEVLPELSTDGVKLRDIVQNSGVDKKYFIERDVEKFTYLKGSKRIDRIKPNGEPYIYSEGAMAFPDPLDKPARTMLTSESSVNRSTHVIEDPKTSKLRLLTPIECERINGFADDWTNTGMPEKFRYFTMGNALVVPLIERMGKTLIELNNADIINNTPPLDPPSPKQDSVYSLDNLVTRASFSVGIPFGKIDKSGRLEGNKGGIGTMIEEDWFGYSPNSTAKADFAEYGIELKVTPYQWKRIKGVDVVRAKERLVANIIDYMEEYKYKTFEDGSFYQKCNSMLMMFYEHQLDIPKSDFHISDVRFITLDKHRPDGRHIFFVLPDEDIAIMRQDWAKIVQKIKDGKAHELSESDTLYLGACTKGATSKDVRKQPFNEVKAKQRAFSLKQSYMSYLLNNYIFNTETLEKVIKDSDDLSLVTFEQAIINKLSQEYGKTDTELASKFNIATGNKSFRSLIVSSILGLKSDVSYSEEFQKAGITCKTIRVETSGKIKESMSFPAIKYDKIATEDWENSQPYKMFGENKFLFVIFTKKKSSYVLSNAFFWNMPATDLNEFEKVWQTTKNIINSKPKLGGVAGFSIEDLPKQSESTVAHVRPHDKNMQEGRAILPDGRKAAKYGFWLNSDYIKQVVEEGGSDEWK